MSRSTTLAGVVAFALTTTALASSSAAAGGNDLVRRGSCSGATHWKVKAGPDDGRIQVEGEIDSNHSGQDWRWRIMHNGTVSAHGTRVTLAPSGSFTVRRLLVDLSGTDQIVFRAKNPQSGEVCRGTIRI